MTRLELRAVAEAVSETLASTNPALARELAARMATKLEAIGSPVERGMLAWACSTTTEQAAG